MLKFPAKHLSQSSKSATTTNMKLYIHIPFCKSKCFYCDFKSFPCGENYAIFDYLNGLNREIELAGKVYGDRNITSIYFGGGTPSLLTKEQFESVFSTIKNSFNIPENIEITVECNPESVDEDKLKFFSSQGVNRISLGVQSLDDRNLKAIGRVHNSITALEKIDLVKKHFDNLSVDFIVGLPYDNNKVIEDEIKAVADKVEHVSVYMLSVEKGTPLEKLVESGKVVVTDADEQIDLFEHACSVLERAGFERYEVSNFAKSGRYSNHNNGYWLREEYLGLGLSASSLLKDEILDENGRVLSVIERRLKNTNNFENYLLDARNSSSFDDFDREEEVLGETEIYDEKIMLALRMNIGVDKSLLGEKVKVLKKKFAPFIIDKGDKIALNGKGMDVMNHILVEIL